jgi:hypothetical protein
VSLKPIDFGSNIILDGKEPSILTMITQILYGLKASSSKYVFFCEHDVLYTKSHFDFTPPRDDVYYYNENVWRWDYPLDRAITYDRLISLSGLCANRELLVENYEKRMKKIYDNGWEKDIKKEPDWARKMGYEPGTKKIKRGGLTDEDFDVWRSEYPIIDVRHGHTFSKRKVTLDSFKHPPKNWRETKMSLIEGWNMEELLK